LHAWDSGPGWYFNGVGPPSGVPLAKEPGLSPVQAGAPHLTSSFYVVSLTPYIIGLKHMMRVTACHFLGPDDLNHLFLTYRALPDIDFVIESVTCMGIHPDADGIH